MIIKRRSAVYLSAVFSLALAACGDDDDNGDGSGGSGGAEAGSGGRGGTGGTKAGSGGTGGAKGGSGGAGGAKGGAGGAGGAKGGSGGAGGAKGGSGGAGGAAAGAGAGGSAAGAGAGGASGAAGESGAGAGGESGAAAGESGAGAGAAGESGAVAGSSGAGAGGSAAGAGGAFAPPAGTEAQAQLIPLDYNTNSVPADGSTTVAGENGYAYFTQTATDVILTVHLSSCTAGNSHPIHIHTGGVCTDPTTQGEHWNVPGNAAGEGIPNVPCPDGTGDLVYSRSKTATTPNGAWTIGGDAATNVLGHTVILHASGGTPADNAIRVACGPVVAP